MFVAVIGFFGEAAFEFWLKIRVHECAELQEAEGRELHGSAHGPCERGVCIPSSAHGAGARTVQQWK